MNSLLLLLLMAATPLTGGEVRVLTNEAVAAFGGGLRPIGVLLQNRADAQTDLDLEWQLLQTSSATAAPFGAVAHWKRLTLPAHQTILEGVPIPLPSVRAETRFLVRFLHQREVLGLEDVWVYPTNLLGEINDLLQGGPLVLCGVPDSWRQTLAAEGINFLETTVGGTLPIRSKLAIVGPSVDLADEGAAGDTAWAWAKSGIGVILVKRTPIPAAAIEPSYYALGVSNTALVIAQANTLTNLAADPWAQLRLIRMARLATGCENHGHPRSKVTP